MSQNDIVIVGSYRTPITKAKRGAIAHLKNNEILYEHIRNTLKSINLSPASIDYVCLGNVLSEMNGTVDARHACLRAGLDVKTPVMTINRQCASGLETFDLTANMLRLDRIEIGLVGGFESMTTHVLKLGNINDHGDSILALGCLDSMIKTAENISDVYHLNKAEIDEYAYNSHYKAYNALSDGTLATEILPIQGVSTDDCVRQPNQEKIYACKQLLGCKTTTAANASQLSDGCALALLMKRKTAEKLGLKIMGVFIDYVVVGVDPSVMGIGPAVAIPNLLKRQGMKIEDVDIFEINEAFASQALYCQNKLGIAPSKLNVNGGAIALGHPLGCTGARLVCALLNNLKSTEQGVVSLCAGTGHGVAALIRKE